MYPDSLPDTAGTVQTERNDHHCVPRSFLGSNADINVSRLSVPEHDAYHRVAGFRPPDFLIRKVLLASINWHDAEGKMIPARLYQEAFMLLTPDDWRSFYDSSSMRRIEEAPNGNGATKAAVHVHMHLWEEQAMVAEAIASVGISRYLSPQVRDFSNNFMSFFRTDDPIAALRNYLQDSSETKERKWTKPLTPSAFSHFCDLTKSKVNEVMSVNSRQQLLTALVDHHVQLNRCIGRWQPSVIDNIAAIAEYGQSKMEDLLRKHKQDPADDH